MVSALSEQTSPIIIDSSSVTVLVIEAGDLQVQALINSDTAFDVHCSDDYEDIILKPIDNRDGLGPNMIGIFGLCPRNISMANHEHTTWEEVWVVGGLVTGMCWTRGGKADYDAWETLGNPGWSWDGLLPYFKRVTCTLPHLVLIFFTYTSSLS